MSAELKQDVAARNPRTVEEARAFVKHVESLFMPWDVEGIVAGFTDDCVVCFGDVPEFQGKAELTRFFRARSARQKGYRLRKELRALMGDVLANYWEGQLGGRADRRPDGRAWRRDLGHARRQDRAVGGGVQRPRGGQGRRAGDSLARATATAGRAPGASPARRGSA
jgi:ketosteroid isomerase-like protein